MPPDSCDGSFGPASTGSPTMRNLNSVNAANASGEGSKYSRIGS